MTIEEIKSRKTALGLTNEIIAESSGIPLSTIQKIMSGATKAPRKLTLEAIESVLYAEEERRKGLKSRPSPERAQPHPGFSYDSLHEKDGKGRLNESGAVYSLSGHEQKKDGEYTLEDYYALPDERRVELIDGTFYDMPAPPVLHQKILGDLHLLFRQCADAHEGRWEVYLSPCDVRLDMDDRTMVQPDLFMSGKPCDLDAAYFEGAPDLALEILSPFTRAKDMLLKPYKYQNAGVREYWIVDPDHERVLVYDFRTDSCYPDQYDFESLIPVHISERLCSIDFSIVSRALKKVRSGR